MIEMKSIKKTGRRQLLGRSGEEVAAKYLENKGWRIVERNYRCRQGEIDLIAVDSNTLVFVEVRSRSSTGFGTPQESVGYKKQKKVRSIARHYFYDRKIKCQFTGYRFDVLAVKLDSKNGRVESLEHIKNAF